MAQTAAQSGAQVAFHRKVGIVKERAPMPRQKWPQMIEAEYAKAIIDMLARSKAGIIEIVNAMPQLIASAAVGSARTDADEGRRAREMVDAARAKMRQTIHPNEIDKLAEKFGMRTANYHKSELAKQVHATFGIDVHYVDRPGARISNFAAASVAHIQSIPERLHDSVSKLVTRGISEGMSHDTLAGHIEEAYATGETDARRIARDQIGKLYGALNADRQKSMGVNRFVWRTAGDERVRDEHADLEGQEFSYDDGGDASEGLPGEPIQCRCYAEPVLDDILGETDDGEGLPDITPDGEQTPVTREQTVSEPQQLPPGDDEAAANDLVTVMDPVEAEPGEEIPEPAAVPPGFTSLGDLEEEMGIDAKQMRGILRKLDIEKPAHGWSWPPEQVGLVKQQIAAAQGKKKAPPKPDLPPPMPPPIGPPIPLPPPKPVPEKPVEPIERAKDEPPPIPKPRVRNPRKPKREAPPPLSPPKVAGVTQLGELPKVVKGSSALLPSFKDAYISTNSAGTASTGLNAIDRSAQRNLRVANNEVASRYNLPARNRGAPEQFELRVKSDKDMGNADAFWSPQGNITIRQTVASNYAKTLQILNDHGDLNRYKEEQIRKDPYTGTVSGRQPGQAFRIVTHETVHAHGPPAEYKGFGVYVEEIATESAARRITRETLNLKDDYSPQLLDGHIAGAYGGMINHATQAIRSTLTELGVPLLNSKIETPGDHFGPTWDVNAGRMLGDASLRYKSYAENPFSQKGGLGPTNVLGKDAPNADEQLQLFAHSVDFKSEAAKHGITLTNAQVESAKANLITRWKTYKGGEF